MSFFRDLFIILVVLGRLATAQSAEISASEFRQDIREHRARVLEISLEMFRRFPERFKSLSSLGHEKATDILRQYIALHDLPKLMSRDQLESIGIKRGHSIFDDLREAYGSCEAPSCVRELNEIEEFLKERIMAKVLISLPEKIWPSILSELKLLELTSDVLDTKLHRGPELNFVPKLGEAQRYLENRGHFIAAMMAQGLESWAINLKINRDTMNGGICRDVVAN